MKNLAAQMGLRRRLMGFNADAAIISEPSFLRVCPAQRGGRIAHVTLNASGGVLAEGSLPPGVIDQLTFLLGQIQVFAAQRRKSAKIHAFYNLSTDPVPVTVTKVITSPWGTGEPITIPEQCKVEIYWQTMPGEAQGEIDREFIEWLNSLASLPDSPFLRTPQVDFPIRWLRDLPSPVGTDHNGVGRLRRTRAWKPACRSWH